MIGFKSIFVPVFGGVGLGLLIYIFKAPRKKELSTAESHEQPWLAKDQWQSSTVKSNSKATMWGAWFLAAFWNLISAPRPFVVYAEVTEKTSCRRCSACCFQ